MGTLSQLNYEWAKQLDHCFPCVDVRRAQVALVMNSLHRQKWVQLAEENMKLAGIGNSFAPISGGVAITAISSDIGLKKPWEEMATWGDCVPASPARVRGRETKAPVVPHPTVDVEDGRDEQLELRCSRELLRDGVVGPVIVSRASQLYNYLFKGRVDGGKFCPAFTVTNAITYAVSYKYETNGHVKMTEANFLRIVRTLKTIHPHEAVFIWIDQQLRKCPEKNEWIKRGVTPYIAFPTVRLGHRGEERVWIAVEKTAAAKHCVRIDIPLEPNQATLVVNDGLQYPSDAAVEAVAGFLCGEPVTTFGVTYKDDLHLLRAWVTRVSAGYAR